MTHQIGAGVLGPVFRAYNPPHDRPFAVKAFHVDITPEQAETLTGRFGELVATGAFHPGVVPVTAVGIDDGVLYLAQEYVAGDSLDAVMRDYAPAALHRALTLIDRLAGAIDAAHACGVRHGGLHLRDIFVTPSGGRVTGFGVVAALEEIGVSGPIRRPYAAPEMIARRAWGPAADRFALAAVAYELLTGKRAAGTGAQVAARLADLDAIEDVESLQAVFETALADGPDGRYASAARFAADLHAAVGVPFDEEALELAPPLPAGGAEPAPAGPAERPGDRDGVEEAAAPAAEILVDPLPGETEGVVGDDGPGLAAEPAADLEDAEVGAAEPRATGQEPGSESAFEPEPALEPAPEIEPAREFEPAFEPEPTLETGPALEQEPVLEQGPALEPGPESRSSTPSLFAETLLDQEIEPEPDPDPGLEAPREREGARTRPAPRLLDDRDLLDRMDDPGAPDDRGWAAADVEAPAGDDDVPQRPWASGSVAAIAVVLSVGAIAAYLVGLQLAGNQGLEGGRGGGRELAAPGAGGAGGPTRAAATVAASPPPAAGAPDAPAESVSASEQVRAPSPAPPPPAESAAPSPLVESAVPLPFAERVVPPPLAAADAPPLLPGAPPATREGAAPVALAPALSPAPPPAAAAGWLLVRTEPPGAMVTIDGVDRGRTPLALSDMPFDTYRVEVSREGFRSQSAALTLSPAATVASIAIELPPGADPPPAPAADTGAAPPPAPAADAPADPPRAVAVGAVRVESRPPGARVVIDGREVGTTPTVVFDVAAGVRSLRIELDGYQPWVASVDVPASDQVRVGASLDLLP